MQHAAAEPLVAGGAAVVADKGITEGCDELAAGRIDSDVGATARQEVTADLRSRSVDASRTVPEMVRRFLQE